MTRRYLAYRPDEVLRIFHTLDLIAPGAEGHGPVHLLLSSAAEIGFAFDGVRAGLDSGCPPSPQDAVWVCAAFSERCPSGSSRLALS